MEKKSRFEPVYLRLFRRMQKDILSGNYRLGELLPSDKELAEKFGVSRYTAREAYSELVRHNMIRRVRRKGTMVTYDPSQTSIRKVGLIMVADVPAYFLFEKGVESVLGDRGAGLFVQYSYDDPVLNERAIEEAVAHDVQGLITCPPHEGSFESYRRLLKDNFPIVLALASNADLQSIFPDDYNAGGLVGEHFGKQGFQHPAAVIQDRPYSRERLYGFKEGLAHSGIRLDENRVIQTVMTGEENHHGKHEVEQLLALDPVPDAVFAVNDTDATAVYFWLMQAGLRVPEDIAVAGVDNLGSKFHPFPLTTVDIGLEEAGKACAEAILSQIETGQTEPLQRKLEPQLIVSDSTRR